MTVGQIVSEVRLCIDEKAENGASFASASAGDNTAMNEIIRAKIKDALIWVLLYAPTDMLDSLDTTPTSSNSFIYSDSVSPTAIEGSEASLIVLPQTFMRLIRVRVTGWGKAIQIPIEEDSEKYIQLTDEVAKATIKDPQAAIIRTSPNKLELWPGNGGASAHLTYIHRPETDYTDVTDSTAVAIPTKARTAFLYYIAFLVLAAYRDPSANTMLEIAKASIGKK